MIAMVGIKKDIPIQIRESFSIKKSKKDKIIKGLLESFKEVVILNTCNRTEIYFNHSFRNELEIINNIFEILEWDEILKAFVFYIEGDAVSKHLFEVACGYHSKITGEDQILGQIKDSYAEAQKYNAVSGELGRLFQLAITCGKKFRTETKLYEIPVSSVSVVVNKIVKQKCQRVMVIGYGEVGKLAIKYLLGHKFEEIYLVVRDVTVALELQELGINVVAFKEKNKYINNMDAVISCTSASHAVVLKNNIEDIEKPMLIFDMAVPRDVEAEVDLLSRTRIYNIDEISEIDDENKELRIEKMNKYRHIVDSYIEEYKKWNSLRDLSPIIKELNEKSNFVSAKRIETYDNKKKDNNDEKLVKMLIKSTSDAYVHKAIEVLKEERLQGCEDECLRIIKKIFLTVE